jgi:hypothetical protein
VVDYVSNNLNNESEVYSAEFIWHSEDFSCLSLKPTSKGRQEELKFTFNVSKCDRIFDELLKLRNIKISHTMRSLDEIKRCAYLNIIILILMLLMIECISSQDSIHHK